MAVSVLNNVLALWDGYDLSTRSNAAAINYGADMVENTTFGNDTHTNTGGLKVVDASIEGYWDGATYDPALFAGMGAVDKPLTIVPEGATAGNVALFHLSVENTYNVGGAVGELLPFSFASQASDQRLIRGALLHKGAETVTGNSGAGIALPAVASGESLYIALHVLAVTGSLTVTVETDVDSGFATPVTQWTSAAHTTIGSEWATPVAGPITDTQYRATWTLTGTATFAVVVGKQ